MTQNSRPQEFLDPAAFGFGETRAETRRVLEPVETPEAALAAAFSRLHAALLGTGEMLRVAEIETIEPGGDRGEWRSPGGYRKFEQLDPEEQAAALKQKSYKTAFLRMNPAGELAYSMVTRHYGIPLLPAMDEADPETLNTFFYNTKTEEWTGAALLQLASQSGWTAAMINQATAIILGKAPAAQLDAAAEYDFGEVVRSNIPA